MDMRNISEVKKPTNLMWHHIFHKVVWLLRGMIIFSFLYFLFPSKRVAGNYLKVVEIDFCLRFKEVLLEAHYSKKESIIKHIVFDSRGKNGGWYLHVNACSGETLETDVIQCPWCQLISGKWIHVQTPKCGTLNTAAWRPDWKRGWKSYHARPHGPCEGVQIVLWMHWKATKRLYSGKE